MFTSALTQCTMYEHAHTLFVSLCFWVPGVHWDGMDIGLQCGPYETGVHWDRMDIGLQCGPYGTEGTVFSEVAIIRSKQQFLNSISLNREH